MSSVTIPRTDARPLWLRLLVWTGLAILVVLAPPFVLFGLVAIGDGEGKFILCFGLLLLVGAVAGAAREVSERRLVRDPVAPRLDRMPDGERALLLPRATEPTLISSWGLFGFGAVLLVGALLAAVEASWGLAVVLTLTAAWFLLTAVPHRAERMAGGLWLTPTRVVDDYRGVRWEVPWELVTGVDAHHRQRVLLPVRRDRVPALQRTGPRGRAWKPLRAGNVMVIDTNHLAGGTTYAGDLIDRALTHPASRQSLGTHAPGG